jgi:hypothetical protein
MLGRGDCGTHARGAGPDDQDIAFVSIVDRHFQFLFMQSDAPDRSNDFVGFDEKGRYFGDEFRGVDHQGLAGVG